MQPQGPTGLVQDGADQKQQPLRWRRTSLAPCCRSSALCVSIAWLLYHCNGTTMAPRRSAPSLGPQNRPQVLCNLFHGFHAWHFGECLSRIGWGLGSHLSSQISLPGPVSYHMAAGGPCGCWEGVSAWVSFLAWEAHPVHPRNPESLGHPSLG